MNTHELIAWITEELIEFDWQPAETQLSEQQIELQKRLVAGEPSLGELLFRLGASDASIPLSPSLTFLREIAAEFFQALTHDPGIEFTRGQTKIHFAEDKRARLIFFAPYLPGDFQVTFPWIDSIWQSLQEIFSAQIERFTGSVESYLQQMAPRLHVADRICFHLVENKDPAYPFAFLATCTDRDAASGQLRQVPLQQLMQNLAQPDLSSLSADPVTDKKNQISRQQEQVRLLASIHRAAQTSDLIRRWQQSGEIIRPLRVSAADAWTFLKEIPLYESCGIVCRIPKWWKNRKQSAQLKMTVGDKPASHLGLEALLDFQLDIVLNGETLTEDELQAIVHGTAGLQMIKGKWIEADPAELARLLADYQRIQKLATQSGLSILDLFRLQLFPEKIMSGLQTEDTLEINQGEWLSRHLSRLSQKLPAASIQDVADTGEDFKAQLRPYQQKGLQWLTEMTQLGLGACLADDMGLGKTIQVIALLNTRRTSRSPHQSGKTQTCSLIVLPATLLTNWAREIDQFAPSLRYQIVHPSAIALDSISPEHLLADSDVILTTYGLVQRLPWLKAFAWDLIILDEAQAIKNPATKQTRAVKSLSANVRIALTGTPIENRLSDLWSLFDFLNKGLLGTPTEFTAFCKGLPGRPNGYAHLREVISPFLLRRVKTDQTVISDLPAKVEMKAFASLTKKQAALYQTTVSALEKQLNRVPEGIERKGLVLKTLLQLKQICNHPDLFHGLPVFASPESGKFERLQEICETIRDRHERVLVFTQFREMCEPLSRFLATVFGKPGLVLHGQVPVAKRRQLIDHFQGSDYVPFMVLSLKAGGTGLNLTAANHVVHFDRWWNPAVENQATDRSFRIGQNKRVVVHAFVTTGTVEEKIDALIESKKQLASDVIPDRQDSFITEMDNRQLLDLLRLERHG